jgi:predicted phage terminase large subunit-like protein
VGIGGALTGFPAKWAVIDDPVKNLAEARSEVKRQEFKDWYRSVLRTRIQQGGAIVIIMTRWDEDDAAGWLLREQPGEWTVLRYPALAETQQDRDTNNKLLGLPEGLPDLLGRASGEALAPHRFSREALLATQNDVGSTIWAGLYDGMPRKADGNVFKRHWFPIVDPAPRKGKRMRYWDKAGTEGGDGAATAGLLMLECEDGLTYIEDVVRGWYSAFEREKVIKQTAELDALRYGAKSAVKIYVEQEPGSGGKESADATVKNLKGFVIKTDRPTGDKDTRLEPFAAQAEAGNVRLVRGVWNEDYIEEMIAIPNGKRRDQGDASSGAFNRLQDAGKGGTTVGYSGLGARRGRR